MDSSIIATVTPINAARAQKRATQWLVTCTNAPEHDLVVEGTITVDYADGSPHTATFDPDNESIANAVIPVLSLTESNGLMSVVTDEDEPALWTFAIESDPREEAGDDVTASAPKLKLV